MLFISHSREVGGAERYLQSLLGFTAQGIGEERVGVRLVCRADHALDGWVDGIAKSGVAVLRLDLTRWRDYVRLWRLMRSAALVHLVLAYPVGKYQLVSAWLCRLARRPLVITHQLTIDIDTIEMAAWRRSVWQRVFRSYGRITTRHIAVSSPGRNLLVRRYGVPDNKIDVIPNGVDLSRYRPLTQAERNRARADIASSLGQGGFSPQRRLVLTVARLNVQKGLEDLVAAIPQVRSDVREATFVIVGGGELEDALREQIRLRDLGDVVFLAGPQPSDRVASWMGAADLFVLPSRDEGLPFALIEAMAAGCAAVASNVGGVPDVIEHQVSGLLVPPRDPAALAGAIIALLSDEARRHALAMRGEAEVKQKFDLAQCLARTEAVYRAVSPAGSVGSAGTA